jgi:phosphoribosyl-dephospho-CoA transferase
VTPISRHRWVHVAPAERASIAAACAHEALRSEVAEWLALDRPLIARARRPGETSQTQPLGLCLPRARATRRVSLAIAPAAVARVEEVATLHEVERVLPPSCLAVTRVLCERAMQLGFEARAFGSAAWQWRTGENYLHEDSDLDLLAAPPDAHALKQWLALLDHLDATSPMRLDGEIECPSGDAVNWRELARGPAQVLLKSNRGARLETTQSVWSQFR